MIDGVDDDDLIELLYSQGKTPGPIGGSGTGTRHAPNAKARRVRRMYCCDSEGPQSPKKIARSTKKKSK